MVNKKSFPIILIIAGVALMIGGLIRSHYLNSKEQQINTVLNTRKQILKKYKLKAENPISTMHPKTASERSAYEQLQLAHHFSNTANAFFNVIFTFNSQNQWVQRQNKARQYTTEEVLRNKNIFNSGKDISGHSIITTERAVSNFNGMKLYVSPIDGQTQTAAGLAKVTYSGSTFNTNASSHTDIYLVKYDLHQQKLIQVQRVGELTNEGE